MGIVCSNCIHDDVKCAPTGDSFHEPLVASDRDAGAAGSLAELEAHNAALERQLAESEAEVRALRAHAEEEGRSPETKIGGGGAAASLSTDLRLRLDEADELIKALRVELEQARKDLASEGNVVAMIRGGGGGLLVDDSGARSDGGEQKVDAPGGTPGTIASDPCAATKTPLAELEAHNAVLARQLAEAEAEVRALREAASGEGNSSSAAGVGAVAILEESQAADNDDEGQATTAKIFVLLDTLGLLPIFQGVAQALVGMNRGTPPPSSLMEAWDLLSTQITQAIEALEGAQDGGESKGVPKGDAAGPAAAGTVLSVFVETLVRLVYACIWVPVCGLVDTLRGVRDGGWAV